MQILENAAGVVGSPTDVTNQFDAAVSNDFTVVRAFAFGTEAGFALQTTQASHLPVHASAICLQQLTCMHLGLQGQYNEQAFKALDFIISEASKRGLRLVLALADNWLTDSNTDNK